MGACFILALRRGDLRTDLIVLYSSLLSVGFKASASLSSLFVRAQFTERKKLYKLGPPAIMTYVSAHPIRQGLGHELVACDNVDLRGGVGRG